MNDDHIRAIRDAADDLRGQIEAARSALDDAMGQLEDVSARATRIYGLIDQHIDQEDTNPPDASLTPVESTGEPIEPQPAVTESSTGPEATADSEPETYNPGPVDDQGFPIPNASSS